MKGSIIMAIVLGSVLLTGCSSSKSYTNQAGQASASSFGKGCAAAKVGKSLVISCSGEDAVKLAKIIQTTSVEE